MYLIRRPKKEFSLLDEFDKLLDSSLDFLPMKGYFSFGNTPLVDISEDKDNLHVKADLPGVNKNEIKVSVDDGVLSIKGERKHELEKKDKNFYRLERSYGVFQKCLVLPKSVDAKKAQATYKDGVLEIALPKKPEQDKEQETKIEVK